MRIKWVDRAKGLAIVLVVLGHVILGLIRSNQYTDFDNNCMRYVIEAIYAFHMPVFFALSGMFFKRLANFKEPRLHN
ncbi:acyltransferase family protein [Lacticaseibacillus paracasei]|uniref:acyltransferase family protein n=1 Tax=Lacticaseibacillus paracasei TaxID=1597 RepID=UPI00385772D9